MHTPRKLLRITTVPVSLHLLLRGQLPFFQGRGYEVLAVSAPGPEVATLKDQGIRHASVPMTRTITPWRDLVNLFLLCRIMHRFRPHIVHTHTPKAGLLGMLAAWLCRVPVRLHTVAGLPLMESSGFQRRLLRLTEQVTYGCAHAVYPNSFGLLSFMQRELGVGTRPKFKVLGHGSTNGIDTAYFSLSDPIREEALRLRARLGIGPGAAVFLFIGRLVPDKGIRELIEAFRGLSITDHSFLVLVGPPEAEAPLSADTQRTLENHPHIRAVGFQVDVRPWLAMAAAFVFPSYREGFPNVVMQAACMEVPCIVSDINGCNELIEPGVRGWVVPAKQVLPLRSAMEEVVREKEKAARYATASRNWVVSHYDQRQVWTKLSEEYEKHLKHVLE